MRLTTLCADCSMLLMLSSEKPLFDNLFRYVCHELCGSVGMCRLLSSEFPTITANPLCWRLRRFDSSDFFMISTICCHSSSLISGQSSISCLSLSQLDFPIFAIQLQSFPFFHLSLIQLFMMSNFGSLKCEKLLHIVCTLWVFILLLSNNFCCRSP